MKIGEAIQALERSDGESTRILSSVQKGIGKPAELFSSYAQTFDQHNVLVKAQRTLGITGFRPGKAKDLILARVINGLKTQNFQVLQVFWMIYRHCVIAFLHEEQANLNKLLLETDLDNDPDSTDYLLKSIKNAAPIYDVSDTEIEDFYEFYWFERTENLSHILSESDVTMDVVEALIKKSEIGQKKQLDSLSHKLIRDEPSTETIMKIDRVKSELSSTKESIRELRADFDLESAKFEKNFVELIERRITDLEATLASSDDQEKQKQLENTVAKNQESIDRLNNRIKVLTDERKRKESKKQHPFASNPDGLIERLKYLPEARGMSTNQNALLRKILDDTNSFYVDSNIIFSIICGDLIKEGRVKEVVLTPSVLDFNNDEYEEFCSYDVLYLRNLSSTYLDGTVLPLLIKSNSEVETTFPKVFLEKDPALSPSFEARILHHSVYLSFELISQITSMALAKKQVTSTENNQILSSMYSDAAKMLSNHGIALDRLVYDSAIKIGFITSNYCSVDEAYDFSFRAIIIPCVTNVYGINKAQVVIELFNDLFPTS